MESDDRACLPLVDSERRYRALFENMNAGFVLFEAVLDDRGTPVDLNILAANHGFERTTGLSAATVTGQRLTRVLPGIERDEADWIGTYGRVALTGTPCQLEQGSDLLGRVYSVNAYQSEPGQCAVTFRDITDSKQAEQRIRRLNRTYALLSDINQLMVRNADPQAILTGACQIAVAKGGFRMAWAGLRSDPEGPLTLAAHQGAGPETLAIVQDLLDSPAHGCAFTAEALATGRHAVCDDVEHDPLAAPWREAAIHFGYRATISLPLLVGGQAVGVLNLYSGETRPFDPDELRLLDELAADLSFALESARREQAQRTMEEELRAVEEQIRRSQKMESLGCLAGGIAHDMNNVLGAIFAVTQTARLRYSDQVDLDQALATVERAATRGRDLVRGLLGLARMEIGASAPVDINQLVQQEMELLERTLLQKIRLVVDLEQPLPPVLAETSSLASALMNLCVNAADAMPDGGTLTLRTRNRADAQVEITVEDTGLGMSPKVLERAMDPFFTTKEVGKGTGLGLAMVFNAAKAHGGTLTLHSQEGVGTRAVLLLPGHSEPVPSPVLAESRTPAAAAMKLLLVDDDELLRDAVPFLLETLGHQVDVAAGGEEALAYLAAGNLPDAIILDLNMPGMDGLETLRRLRSPHPTLPVLLATGFLGGAAEAVVRADRYAKAINKPFSIDQVQAKLIEVRPMAAD
jgi:PAS domain S-box-containing protein